MPTLAEHLRNMALPTLSLALIMMAYITRVTRSAMLEVLNQDFVRTARAKGAPGMVVIWRHALGNCLIPITTVVGLYLGILIGNSVLTEIVFNRPGLGKLILNALTQRDYTLLQGLIVIYTLLVVVVNLITDLTYGLPRSAGAVPMSDPSAPAPPAPTPRHAPAALVEPAGGRWADSMLLALVARGDLRAAARAATIRSSRTSWRSSRRRAASTCSAPTSSAATSLSRLIFGARYSLTIGIALDRAGGDRRQPDRHGRRQSRRPDRTSL